MELWGQACDIWIYSLYETKKVKSEQYTLLSS